MANRIVGLDIGTFAVKVVTIEVQRELEVVDYREILLHELKEEDGFLRKAEEEDSDSSPEEGGEESSEDVETPAGESWHEGPVEGGESFGASSEDAFPLWGKALRKLQREGYFEEVNQIITSFPDGKAVTLHIEVPFAKKVESILPHLLADQLPLPINQVIYDFIVIPGAKSESFEALVGVVEKTDLAEFLATIQESGIDPIIVGVPELMLRYMGDQGVDPSLESYGIIDFGHEFTRLLIISEGRPVVARSIRTGGAAITAELAQKFRLSEDDAMRLKHQRGQVGEGYVSAQEEQSPEAQIGLAVRASLQPVVRDLRRTFQSAYAKYNVAVEGIYICGGGSRLEGLIPYLHQEFQVPVEPLRAGETLVFGAPEANRRLPEMAQALGCALQGPTDVADLRLIDFRQKEFVYRGRSSYLRSQVVRIGAIGAVLFVMLIAVLAMQYFDQRAQLRAMQVALAQQSAEIFGEPVRSPAEVGQRLTGQAGPDRNFVPRMSAYELFVRISENMTEEIPLRLEQVQIDTGRNLATLIGVTDSPQSVDTFAAGIERLECVTEVRKEGVNVRGENDVRFELNINNNCS